MTYFEELFEMYGFPGLLLRVHYIEYNTKWFSTELTSSFVHRNQIFLGHHSPDVIIIIIISVIIILSNEEISESISSIVPKWQR